jgi:hypothetical protein
MQIGRQTVDERSAELDGTGNAKESNFSALVVARELRREFVG